MVHICNEYYSSIKRNTIESVLMKRIKLEPVIQSEVSLKEKTKCCILTHIYGTQKDGNNDPMCKAAKGARVKDRLLDSVVEGEGGMI